MKSGRPKVLVAPLDWGLGHATRVVPVIESLLKYEADIILSASGNGKILLQQIFPEIPFIQLEGISIRYPAKGSMTLSIGRQLPALISSIRSERKQFEEAIGQHAITHVISDNRYGLHSSSVKSAFITHQVCVEPPSGLPFLRPVLKRVHRRFIERFDELWIPDMPCPGCLSGRLQQHSHIRIPVKHLGILSRFKNGNEGPEKKYAVIAYLSGPEPQRTLLEQKIIPWLQSATGPTLLVRGLPGTHEKKTSGTLEIISSVEPNELLSVLHPDTLLISRPGYSTIMDLVTLGHKRILFIPTPGQTEQEYLARYFSEKHQVKFIDQNDLLPESIKIPEANFHSQIFNDRLDQVIENFLN